MIDKFRERFVRRYKRLIIALLSLLWLLLLVSGMAWEWTYRIRKLFR
jgi:hypothetical protein